MTLKGNNKCGSEETIFVCMCNNHEHMFHVWTWDEDLGFQVMLNPLMGFFRRIVAAVKYIFLVPGYRNIGFEEVLLDAAEILALRDTLSRHICTTSK